MNSEKPRRRWFRPRYSLTTLFVVVTVVGCWLGYSLKWIKDRRNFRLLDAVYEHTDPFSQWHMPSAPGLLWLFGERGAYAIEIDIKFDRDEQLVQRAKRLFPEAYVMPADDDFP